MPSNSASPLVASCRRISVRPDRGLAGAGLADERRASCPWRSLKDTSFDRLELALAEQALRARRSSCRGSSPRGRSASPPRDAARPLAACSRPARVPLDEVRRSPAGARAGGRAAGGTAAAPGCRGRCGRSKIVARRPCSRISPSRITTTWSAISPTTPRSWVMNSTDMRCFSCSAGDQVEDLLLDGDVERRRRLVGDQQLAARRRSPSRSSRAAAGRPRAATG